MDWFRPDVGPSNAKVDCSPPVAFIVGTVLSLFEIFGFFVVLQLFGHFGIFLDTRPACCGAWKRCGQILSGGSFLFLSMSVVSSESLLQTPEGMALTHALAWMLSAFGSFSCWFGLVWFEMHLELQVSVGCPDKFGVWTWKEVTSFN